VEVGLVMKWDCNGTLVHWGRKLKKGGVLKSSFTFPLSQEQKATMPNYGRVHGQHQSMPENEV
jgi:hypothetical protein